MRRTQIVVLALSIAAVACSTAFAGLSRSYRGATTRGGAVSFSVSKDGKYVINFRFANKCPADSNAGTLVIGRMRIHVPKHGSPSFSLSNGQFKISGKFSAGSATGTAHDKTGDCDSGSLHWTATNGRTPAPTPLY